MKEFKKILKYICIILSPIFLNIFIYFLLDIGILKVEHTTHLIILLILSVLTLCTALHENR